MPLWKGCIGFSRSCPVVSPDEECCHLRDEEAAVVAAMELEGMALSLIYSYTAALFQIDEGIATAFRDRVQVPAEHSEYALARTGLDDFIEHYMRYDPLMRLQFGGIQHNLRMYLSALATAVESGISLGDD